MLARASACCSSRSASAFAGTAGTAKLLEAIRKLIASSLPQTFEPFSSFSSMLKKEVRLPVFLHFFSVFFSTLPLTFFLSLSHSFFPSPSPSPSPSLSISPSPSPSTSLSRVKKFIQQQLNTKVIKRDQTDLNVHRNAWSYAATKLRAEQWTSPALLKHVASACSQTRDRKHLGRSTTAESPNLSCVFFFEQNLSTLDCVCCGIQ